MNELRRSSIANKMQLDGIRIVQQFMMDFYGRYLLSSQCFKHPQKDAPATETLDTSISSRRVVATFASEMHQLILLEHATNKYRSGFTFWLGGTWENKSMKQTMSTY